MPITILTTLGNVAYYGANLPISENTGGYQEGQNLIRDKYLLTFKGARLMPNSAILNQTREKPPKMGCCHSHVKYYFTQKKWDRHGTKASDIINSSPHDLWRYAFAVFDPNNEYNVREYLGIDFVRDVRKVNDWVGSLLHGSGGRPKDPTPAKCLKLRLWRPEVKVLPVMAYRYVTGLCQWFSPLDDLRRFHRILFTEYLGLNFNFPYYAQNVNLRQVNSPRVTMGTIKNIFRLADVGTLWQAEAKNELNGPASSYPVY